MSITLNGTNGLIFNDGSAQNTAATGFGFKNRILNGSMAIDQRYAGGTISAATLSNAGYTTDRWAFSATQSAKFSAQQNQGGVTLPAGFKNYLGLTSASAYTLTGNDNFNIYQIIEGYNVADLNWGTASAVPAVLSFWVYSSLTGTFGGSIATTKTSVWSLPFTYTVSSANTWTYVTVSIPASSSATPNTDNTAGVYVRFGLGSTGTSAGGTAGTWTNNNYVQPSGTVSVVSTNGATFYITGVQLEKGSTATSFDYRPYGTELALCQRYYQLVNNFVGVGVGAGTVNGMVTAPITMRTSPSFAVTGPYNLSDYYVADATQSSGATGVFNATPTGAAITLTNFTGITTGRIYLSRFANSSLIAMSAEL